MAEVTVTPSRYWVSALPEGTDDWDLFVICVERTAPDRWAVRRHSRCLDAAGEWDWESIPSERTDEWLATHRFDLDTALALAKNAAPKIRVNGWTVERVLAEAGEV